MDAIGRQQKKSASAREAICRAAIGCLIDLGYAETSIQRVVERTQLSKGALQHHFRTKEDLIAAVVETLLGRGSSRDFPLRAREEMNASDIVRSELRSVWDGLINTGAYRALLEILVAARTDVQLRARIEPMLYGHNQRIDQHERLSYEAVSGDAADVELLMVMNRALMRGLVIQDRFVADPAYIDRIIEKWIDFIAPLLGPRRKPYEVEALDEEGQAIPDAQPSSPTT